MDCVFCKIVDGEIPSKKVYEDGQILAIYDLEPQAPVHVLFIPKERRRLDGRKHPGYFAYLCSYP